MNTIMAIYKVRNAPHRDSLDKFFISSSSFAFFSKKEQDTIHLDNNNKATTGCSIWLCSRMTHIYMSAVHDVIGNLLDTGVALEF